MTMARPATPDDKWIQAAQSGDRDAFDALVELHGRSVLRYVERLVSDRSEAEDIVQEALLQAYRRLSTFTPGTNFRAWVLKIAYRTCVHGWRKKKVAPSADRDVVSQVAAPAEVRGDAELDAAVRLAIAALPEDQRIVVHLRFVENMSHADIAQITDSELATVRWRLFQARQTMQKRLSSWAPCEEVQTK